MLAATDERSTRGNRGRPRSASFGPYEIRLDTGELRKHGVRVRLQAKPFQILRALLEGPGAVLTREELRTKLWSTDIDVDFESGLNTAVNRLRTALADSAESPVYIETLSRIGYRFIAPVEFGGLESTLQAVESSPPAPDSNEPAVTQGKTDVADPSRIRVKWTAIVWVTVLLAGSLIWALRSFNRKETPEFRQLTFSNGEISDARFAGDGSNVVYSANWKGKKSRLFLKNLTTDATKDLGFEGAVLAGVSPRNDLAVLFHDPKLAEGRLRVFSLSGQLLATPPKGAMEIDWSRDGNEALIVRDGTEYRVEYPSGQTLYRTRGWIDGLRISPDGKKVAFLRHPVTDDDAGDIVLAEPGSQARVLSPGWASARGLAWSPSGREILFTTAHTGIDRQLMAVNVHGQMRRVAAAPGGISLHDISASGDVLVTRDASQMSMFQGQFKAHTQRDISWLDWPIAEAISGNGREVLFDESADGGGREYSSYVYDAEAKSYRRLGPGRAMDLSTDGHWAVTQNARDPNSLLLTSVLDGNCRSIAPQGFFYRWVKFMPSNDSELLVGGSYGSDEEGIFRQRLPDGKPERLSVAAKLNSAVVDASGDFVAGESSEADISLVDLRKRTVRVIPNPERRIPLEFIQSDELMTWREEQGSIAVATLDLRTGAVREYDRIGSEPDITSDVVGFLTSQDLQTYAYCRLQVLSTLFSVRGWK